MNAVETQEAGTGKWFPIIVYTPGTATQFAVAYRDARTLQALGYHARVTGFDTTEGATS